LPVQARAQQAGLRPPPLPTVPPPAPDRSDSLRVSELSARLAAREEALRRAHQELEAARAHAAALLAESHKQKLALDQLQARVRSEAELRVRLSAEQAESERQRRQRVEELERQLASLHQLQASVGELRRLAAGAAEYQAHNAELERALAAARQRVAELEQRPAVPAPGADELTRIRGIGPAFERALHAQGIHSLAQIAALQDADIAALAPVLRVRPERIARDDWRGQAAALLAGQQPAKPHQTE
jgi:large subunit ribosomal protein L21